MKNEDCDEMAWLEVGAKDAMIEKQMGLFRLVED